MKIFYTLLLTAFSLSLFAQSVSISGSSSSAFGDTKSYTVTVSGIDLSQSDIGWYVSSGNSISEISDTQVNITWNSSGTQSVTFDLYIGDDYYSDTKTVTVSAPPVATPSAPQLVANGTCVGQATLRRVGSPPTGVTWYWQGKNSNGTSTSLGSGQYYYPNSSTGGSGYYYLRARNNSTGTWSSGLGRSPNVTITTSPEAPGGNSGSNSCGGPASYTLQAASEETDINGLTHKWYTSATGSGTVPHTIVSSGGQYLTQRAVTSNTNYWVSAVKNGCESGRTQVSATIYPNTAPSISFDDPSAQCEGTTFEIGVAGGVNSTFQWFNGPSGGGVLGTGSIFTRSLNYSETTSGSKSFYVGGTLRDARGCTYPISPRRQVTVTVLPNTSQVNISGSTTVSNGGESTYSASASHASNYAWTISPTSAGSLSPNGSQCSINFNSSFYGQATLSVTASNGCNSTPDSHTIIVLPPTPPNPTISVSGVCSDDGEATLTRNGSPPSGVTWYWQGRNSNGTSTNLGSGSTYIANGGSGTYYVRARHNSTNQWSSGSGSRSVTITTRPEAPGGNSGSNSCGAPASYTLQAASEETDINGLTHKWYTSATGSGTVSHTIVSSGGQYLTQRAVTSNTNYWVSAVKNGCESGRTQVSATIYPNTAPSISFDDPSAQCEGTTFEIGVAGGVNSTFQWFNGPSGGGVLGTGSIFTRSLNYSETTSGSKSFYVGGTLRDARGCTYPISPRRQVTVTVLPNTSQVNISGSTTVSNGGESTYSASASHASNYTWTISPTSAASLSPNGSQCSVNFNSSFYGQATLSVTASNSCNSTQDSNTITVLPPNPPAPILSSDGTCVGQATLQRSGSPSSGVIWYWQGKNSNGTSTTLGFGQYYYPNESTGGSGRYYIRAYHSSTGSWSSASGQSPNVTITTTPEAPGGNSGSNSCGAPASYTLQAASEETDINGLTHKWYTSSTGSGTVSHTVVSSGGQYLTQRAVTSNTTYWVSAIKNGCESGRTQVSATIHPNTAPSISFDDPSSQCEGSSFEMGVAGGVNSTFQWYGGPSGGSSLGTGSIYSPTLNYSETTSGSKSFWVGGTLRDSRGCTYPISPRRQITVTVLPNTSQVNISSGNTTVSNGAQSVAYSATASHASNYSWSINPTSAGILSPNGSQCSVNFNSSFYGQATLSVTASNSCNSTQDSNTITVLPPNPPAPILSSDGTCVGQATLQRSGSPPSGVIWYWQGKNSNGTSTTLGSAEYYYPNESTGGSGRYYIRAYHSSTGSWSSASGQSPNVTITTTPEAPGGNSGSNSCGGSANYTLQAASEETDITGLTHIWYTDEHGSGTVAHTVVSSGGQYLTEVFVGSSVTYWVSAIRDGCESGRTEISATVYPNTAPTISFDDPSSQCEGSTFEIGVAGGVNSTFDWYDESSGGSSLGTGTIYSPTLNYSETTSGSKSYWVGGTLRDSRGCTYPISPRRQVTVTVLPNTSQVNISPGNTAVSNGEQSVAYSATASHATNYAWTINPPSAGSVTQNGSQCSVSFNSSFYGVATLSVTASNSCNSTQDDHIITVLPPTPSNPTISVSGVCSDAGEATLTRNGSLPSGVTWYWQGKNSNGTLTNLGSGSTYIANAGSGTYYMRARDNNTSQWSSGSGSRFVTITTTPEAPGGNSGFNSCGASSYTLQAASEETDITGLTHIWYTDIEGPGTIPHTVVSSEGQYLTEVFVGSSTTYWVSAFRDGCESARTEISATILTKPQIGFDTPGEEQCEGIIFEIGVGGGVNSSFEWYEEPIDGSSIGSGPTIDVNLAFGETTGGFKSFWVGGTLRDVQGCTYPISPRQEVVVSIAVPVESVSIAGEEAVCEATESVNYTASAANANNYLWSINPPSAGVLTQNETECSIDFVPGFSGSATLSVVASNNGCTPKVIEHFLNVSPETDPGVITGSLTKYGVASGSIVLSEHIGSVVKWQSQTTGDWEDILNTESSYQYENVTETTSFRAVLKSGECDQMNSPVATITILDVSFDFGYYQRIRPGQKTTLSVSSEFDSYQWQRNGIDLPGETSSELEAAKPGSYSITISSIGNGIFTTGDAIISSQLDSKQNSVFTYNYQVFTGNAEDPFEFNPKQQVISANVYDGLGRSIQQVALNSSPGQNDLIVPLQYDEFGRQDKNYLPYIDADLRRVYRPNAIDEQLAFHNPLTAPFSNISTDEMPFSLTIFESSPLNRPLKQGALGQAWQPDPDPTNTTDNVIHFGYESNTDADQVWLFDIEDLGTMQFYVEGQLYKNRTTDEDQNEMVEYIDKLGQVIIKESYEKLEDKKARTYYIYDHFNNLRLVIPPEATRRLDTEFFGQPEEIRQAFLNRWAFQYEYDSRKRMTMKKVPGADEVLLVYDRWDRLVLTQDGNQRDPNIGGGVQWLFTKYDALNRPVITGLMSDSPTIVEDMESAGRSEIFDVAESSTHQYTMDTAYPTGASGLIEDYLTVTYYDNYDFVPGSGLSGSEYIRPPELDVPVGTDQYRIEPEPHFVVKRLVTGTKTKILGTEDFLETISYYDDKYRLIQAISQNHQGGVDKISNQYDFIGNVRMIKSVHDGIAQASTILEYEYDHSNRLIDGWHTYNDGGKVHLFSNRYNELGELIEKNLHSAQEDDPDEFQQSIDYEYSIRGWLRSINESGLQGSDLAPEPADLFNMELIYNTAIPNLNDIDG